MAYRVQNHAFNLTLPANNDTLLILVDSNRVTTYVHMPKQVPRKELLKLLPKT